MNELSKETASLFERLKHIKEEGTEYWSARELYPFLGYTQWRNFVAIIDKAKEACKNATNDVSSHFANVSKIVKAGVTEKQIEDILLTRYACYLVAQNGDSRKNLKKSQDILDHMGSTELAANLFRSTQAEEKIRKEKIKGKNNANNAHFQVGREVREAIRRIGGTMPEELPSVESIKKVESKRKKLLKESNKKLKEK